MNKFVFALVLSVWSSIAFAADVAEPAPIPDTNPWALIVFTVLFVGMIVAFFVYMWIKGRNKKEGDPS
jgi:uncharacterized BrkB/YihY/UPF0761 family membrane protein